MNQTNPLVQSAISSLNTVGKIRAKQATSRNNLDRFRSMPLFSQPGSTTDPLSTVGKETVPYGGSTKYEDFHPAVDVANTIGTPIPAFTGGRVVGVTTGKKQGDTGFGNSVLVKDNQGSVQRYSHLHRANVVVGQQLAKGQMLGQMGNSGSTYSPSGGDGTHLDYRIQNAYGKYVNPKTYLKSFQDAFATAKSGLSKLKQSIVQQESGGNYKAVGIPTAHGRALGRYQIIPKFHFDKIGLDPNSEIDQRKFLASPVLQDQLFGKIIDGLANTYENDPKKIAAAYYGGAGAVSKLGTHAANVRYQGGKSPSINDYVSQVTGRLYI